jgi:hypothetical protein
MYMITPQTLHSDFRHLDSRQNNTICVPNKQHDKRHLIAMISTRDLPKSAE